jgi:hypothetical protein
MNVSLIVAIMGMIGAVWSIWSLWFAHASKSWPSTKGRIVASSVDSGRDSRGNLVERAEIAYRYFVGDLELVRSQINGGLELSWTTSIPGISGARDTADSLPLDAEVNVYYWPSHPGIACLRPGKYIGGLFLLMLSAAIIIGSLVAGRA